MPSRDGFSQLHPAVTLLYFALVLGFSMCLLHPICLVCALTGALCYGVQLRGGRAVRFSLVCLLPMLLLAALLNPAFNHQGVTVLAYLPSGNPLTLESVAYGLAAAGMLCAVVAWFFCCNAVLTSDKFVYLFGRMIPSLALVLSMTLRFVPQLVARGKAVAQAQRGVGQAVSQGNLLRRMRAAVAVLSILITWSLEAALDTADSMKSRGYGLKGRTAFSIYRFRRSDGVVLCWLLVCGGYLLTGWALGGLDFRYFPTLHAPAMTAFPVSLLLAGLALCLTPVLLHLWETVRWRRFSNPPTPAPCRENGQAG